MALDFHNLSNYEFLFDFFPSQTGAHKLTCSILQQTLHLQKEPTAFP